VAVWRKSLETPALVYYLQHVDQGCTTFSLLPSALRLLLCITAASKFKIFFNFFHCFSSAYAHWACLTQSRRHRGGTLVWALPPKKLQTSPNGNIIYYKSVNIIDAITDTWAQKMVSHTAAHYITGVCSWPTWRGSKQFCSTTTTVLSFIREQKLLVIQ